MKILRLLAVIGLAFGTLVLVAAISRASKSSDGFFAGLKMQLANILSFSRPQSGATSSW